MQALFMKPFMRDLFYIILIIVFVPIIFFAVLFCVDNFFSAQTLDIRVDIENTPKPFVLEYADKDGQYHVIEADKSVKESLKMVVYTYTLPKNANGLFKINMKENVGRIVFKNFNINTFLFERLVSGEEMYAYFPVWNGSYSTVGNSGALVIETENTNVTSQNLKNIDERVFKMLNGFILLVISIILSIIISRMLYNLIISFILKGVEDQKKASPIAFGGSAVCVLMIIFCILTFVTGLPDFNFDAKSVILSADKISKEELAKLSDEYTAIADKARLEEEARLEAEQKLLNDAEDAIIMREPHPLLAPWPTWDGGNDARVDVKDLVPGAGPFNETYIGYDEWFFFEGTMKDYLGENIFSESALQKLATSFINQQKWLEEQGIAFYITISPNKNTIYPEKMHESFIEAPEKCLDVFIKYMKEHTTIKIIELKEPLMAYKKEHPDEDLYSKWDTHWNFTAGFINAQTIIDTIRLDFPTVVPIKKEDYQIDYFNTNYKDMAGYMGLYDYFNTTDPVYTRYYKETAKLVDIHNYDSTWQTWAMTAPWDDGYIEMNYYCEWDNAAIPEAPTIYFHRDSFLVLSIPFLNESFSHSYYKWTNDFINKEDILEAKPDIVVFQMVERMLAKDMLRKPVFR